MYLRNPISQRVIRIKNPRAKRPLYLGNLSGSDSHAPKARSEWHFLRKPSGKRAMQ